MNVSKVFSASLDGIDAHVIEVETDIHVGLHSFNIVGLADKALSEAKERVGSALKNTGVKPPNKENRKIVVNLAPADLRKTGSHYDLAIAIGYLLASKQVQTFDTQQSLFIGELALNGAVRSVNGTLNIASMAAAKGFQNLFVPRENAAEAAIVKGLRVIPVAHLTDLINHLENRVLISLQGETQIESEIGNYEIDIGDIKGQEQAKRALLIAAAGGHNLLMQGSPGSGKTMLAQALTSILPAPTLGEVIEITKIYSAAGLLKRQAFVNWRPFRSPHQTASPVAIVGGGQNPKPGEISLAHRGILFLDELPEFRRDLLEALRQPLESGKAFVTRAKEHVVFPAKFMLVAAMNPCPCGYYNDEERECRCSAHEVLRYQKKISGPLLDRIDLQITVPRVKIEALQSRQRNSELVAAMRTRVAQARTLQQERFKKIKTPILTNAEMNSKLCESLITLDAAADQFLKQMFEKSLLSARGYYRVLKTARTIADLENSEKVITDHIAEAFQYRLQVTQN